MLPEWFARLLFVAPIHRNALPVEGSLPIIIEAGDPVNVRPRLSAQCSLARNPGICQLNSDVSSLVGSV